MAEDHVLLPRERYENLMKRIESNSLGKSDALLPSGEKTATNLTEHQPTQKRKMLPQYDEEKVLKDIVESHYGKKESKADMTATGKKKTHTEIESEDGKKESRADTTPTGKKKPHSKKFKKNVTEDTDPGTTTMEVKDKRRPPGIPVNHKKWIRF